MFVPRLGSWMLLVAACGTNAAPVPVRHYSDAEIATFKSSLLKRIDDNVQRHCMRPVLHGTATPGPAAPDLRILAEPTGVLADCVKKERELRGGAQARPPKPLDIHSSAVIAFDLQCGPRVEAAVTAAVSHEDACSPYQAGVGAMPERLPDMLRPAHEIGLRAQLRDDPASALWLLADVIRAQQDLMRGHTTLSVAIVANAGMEAALRYAETLVGRIDQKTAAELAPAFDALLASEPSFGGTLAGERDYYGLHFALARLEAKDWVPPGGASSVTQHSTGIAEDHDRGAQALAEVEQLHALHERICPDTANEKACWIGLATHRIALESMAPLGAFPEYVLQRASVTAHLAAVRIALQIALEARCPTVEELASPRYSALRSPAALGDALVISLHSGGLQLAPPAWTGDPMAWSIKCP